MQPKQNRVDPWGKLQSDHARGALMGNRGELKQRDGGYVREWAIKPWIMCEIDPAKLGNIKPRPVKYTKLFFLDEATAFTAGHRPCGTCRRSRLQEFASAWFLANAEDIVGQPAILATLDKVLHGERLASRVGQPERAALQDLPDGTMVEHAGKVLLVADSQLWFWSFHGYELAERLSGAAMVSVLTPRSVVAAYRKGFVPLWDSSASGTHLTD